MYCCYQFGRDGRFLRSLLNICAVILILLMNVHVNSAKFFTIPDEDELICVVMLHRHGDRTPVSTYPTDPHIDFQWPGGLGALTQVGIQQLFDLGLNIRPRYESLKPSDGIYTQETIHAVSSSPERARMSGATMLAAFWEPLENWKPLTIPWQPVPLEVIPFKEDHILYQMRAECPKFKKMYEKLLYNPDPDSSIYKFNYDNSELYEYLSEFIGLNVTNFLPGAELYDILFIQENNGLELPEWTQAIYPHPLYDLRVRWFQIFTENYYMKRLRGGPVITQVYNHFTQFQSGESARKIITYSAHDLTIVNTLNALNMAGQTDLLPSYGALLAFELYRNKNHCRENTVRMVYYANSTVKAPQRLKIPGCPGPCYFSDFGDLIEPLLVTDYHSDCTL